MSSSGVVLHLFCEETAVIVTWNVVVAVDDVEIVVVVVKRASPALHSRRARSNAPIKEKKNCLPKMCSNGFGFPILIYYNVKWAFADPKSW